MLRHRSGPQYLRRCGPQSRDGRADGPSREEGDGRSRAVDAEGHNDRSDMVLRGDNVAACDPNDLERQTSRRENHYRPDRAGGDRREGVPLAVEPERRGDEGDGQDGLTRGPNQLVASTATARSSSIAKKEQTHG